jgi:hypothetical protein
MGGDSEAFSPAVSGVDPATGFTRIEAEHHDLPGWNVVLDVDTEGGEQAEIMALTFIRQDHPLATMRTASDEPLDPAPLTVRAVKSLRLGEFLARAQQHLRLSRPTIKVPTPTQARKQSTNVRLATLCADYIDALAHNESAPRRSVARRWGLTEDQVRDALHEARRRELLTSTNKGTAGGALTDKAIALLRAPSKRTTTRERAAR